MLLKNELSRRKAVGGGGSFVDLKRPLVFKKKLFQNSSNFTKSLFQHFPKLERLYIISIYKKITLENDKTFSYLNKKCF